MDYASRFGKIALVGPQKPGLTPSIGPLTNPGVVAAIGRLYLQNKNETVTTSGGMEYVTEHYATIYKTAPYSANEKSNTQVNDLYNPTSTVRGSVVPEFYPSRQNDVVFLAHSHPPGTHDFPTYPQDFASQRTDIKNLNMWTMVVTPSDIYFMGPLAKDFYYLPASDFINAGKANGTTVSLGGTGP